MITSKLVLLLVIHRYSTFVCIWRCSVVQCVHTIAQSVNYRRRLLQHALVALWEQRRSTISATVRVCFFSWLSNSVWSPSILCC